MSEEIEIEFKNILVEAEYVKLKKLLFQDDDSNHAQVNYYFDTTHFLLKERNCALRIREKNGSYTLTLKEPHQVGLLETHQKLTDREAMSIINKGLAPSGAVTRKLNKIFKNEWSPLNFLGELTTYRLEKKILAGLLVLDRSTYLNTVDFELEFECSDVEKGEIFFQELLGKYMIPKRMTRNKIQRFMDEKTKLNGVEEEQNET